MSNPEAPGTAGAGDDGTPPTELEQIREILFSGEREEIAALRERVDDPQRRAADTSHALPEAVRLSSERGPQLARALAPTMESALADSVRKNPSVLASAIFPIIGPAIRKSIAEAMRGLVESLNQTLDHTLSIESLKWRLEARRTGKRFAEVVISRTLEYRVDQVFLIHTETGLLLQHVHQIGNADSGNADMVSGMLTAIQDFARDSFGVPQTDGLETMQVGELNVWIEASPGMKLAAVIRGVAPQDYRAVMQGAIERIYTELKAALDSFAGNPAPFDRAEPYLRDCLRSQRRKREEKRRSSRIRWIILLLLVSLPVIWGLHHAAEKRKLAGEQLRREQAAAAEKSRLDQMAQAEKLQREQEALAEQHAAQHAMEARENRFVTGLKNTEGIFVTEASHRDGKLYVSGLRDPLAGDPAKSIAESGIDPNNVEMHWERFQALSPGLVLERAKQRLRPPANISLRLNDETLVAAGSAPASWIALARRLGDALPGISGIDLTAVVDETAASIQTLAEAIEGTVFNFDQGITMKPHQEPKLDELAERIEGLRRTLGESGKSLRVTLKGHTSIEGTESFNNRLGRDRAQTIMALLSDRKIRPQLLIPVTVGTREPIPGAEEGANRRVSFKVSIEPLSSGPSVPAAP